MSRRLCNQNFITQFCICKNREYSIEDYIRNRDKFGSTPIYCRNNHELVLANGKIKKAYFRHNNPEDTGGHPMTGWHAKWQGNFPRTEVDYPKKNSNQISGRRADVDLSDRILELQHSVISKEEVDNRRNDYTTVNNKPIVWIIHGNGAISVKRFEQSGRVYVEFVGDFWKYESFLECDYIYIDDAEKIYKICPRKVKSHMIDVEEPKSKSDFIAALKSGTELWSDKEPEQCKLYIRQQGAGNGKTFGIVQMLESNEMAHYNTFIIVTKQHSAKNVIWEEIKYQYENEKLNYISKLEYDDANKKYIIKFHNDKTGKEVKVIIATIDSLMYSIGNRNHSSYDKFQGIIESIIDDHIKADKAGVIRYAGVDPKLNKETLIVIDEAQDLTCYYADALLNIMRNKYVDAYIVGDKLQSISYEENAFTYLYDRDFPSINVEKMAATNECRRFISPRLVSFVNAMAPFKKHGLPPVTPFEVKEDVGTDPLHFFYGEPIYQEDAVDKISKEIEKIMAQFINEVVTNNRQPNDFLIVTPFTTNNPLVDALQGYIDTYWKERLGADRDDYFRYAIFHKSEEGTSINLEESKDSTRIVSTHSSKGDGRNVVFLIGFTESALKRFSLRSGNLIYDSLFHVAITRMKQKLYIQMQNNGDNICQKIAKFCENDFTSVVMPNINIFNSVKHSDLIGDCAVLHFDAFEEKFVKPANLDKLDDDRSDKRIIDAGNHAIRYATLLSTLLVKIINKENSNCDDVKRQIKAKFHMLDKSNVTPLNKWDKYYTVVSAKELAVVKIADRGRDYLKYYQVILDTMNNIKAKLKRHLCTDKIPYFCPFESVVLQHMLEIKNDGVFADIKISDVYNIIDIYNYSYDKQSNGHQDCLCDRSFSVERVELGENDGVKSLKKYLQEHFDKVKYIEKSIDAFHEKYPKINWLYQHVVKYNGMNRNFKLWRKFTLIGYDDERVIIAYIKPQLNSLNYNEILMSSIYDSYIVGNVEQYETDEQGVKKITKNYERFSKRKITTCVFALDRNEPYYINWYEDGVNLIESNSDNIKETIYRYLKDRYTAENDAIYYFYNYWRRNCSAAPGDFVEFLLEEFAEHKDTLDIKTKRFPSYIGELFYTIKVRVDMEDSKRGKRKILEDYDDKEYFMAALEKKLDESVKRYLDMRDMDGDSDSSDGVSDSESDA